MATVQQLLLYYCRILIVFVCTLNLIVISREWYSYHFPELVKLVPDNYSYARVSSFIGDRKEFGKDKMDGVEEILMDSVKARAIVEAARVSMGRWSYTMQRVAATWLPRCCKHQR